MTEIFKKILRNERLAFLVLVLWSGFIIYLSLYVLNGIYSCKDLYFIKGDNHVSADHFIKMCQTKQIFGNILFYINFVFPAFIGFAISQVILNFIPEGSGNTYFIASFIPAALIQTWYLSKIIARKINEKYFKI